MCSIVDVGNYGNRIPVHLYNICLMNQKGFLTRPNVAYNGNRITDMASFDMT
jgi:hypothetical protein